MNSIQEIFKGRFTNAHSAVVQKLRPDQHNLDALHLNFTEHWPHLEEHFDLIVVAIGETSGSTRDIWAGFIHEVVLSPLFSNKVRIYADRFERIGVHDRARVSDASFYGNNGGGGARVKVWNDARNIGAGKPSNNRPVPQAVPEGLMEQRLVWVRKNHARFRDPVWQHWDGLCAVHASDCNGLLIASHIHPWARSTPAEKTDVNNGLLLAAPLDKLFDRGLISFADSGEMLVKNHLDQKTCEIFGVSAGGMRIGRMEKLNANMRSYLGRHRQLHGF